MISSSKSSSPSKSPRDLIEFFEPRPFMTTSKSSENMKKYTEDEKAVASTLIELQTSTQYTPEDKAVADVMLELKPTIDAANTLVSLKNADS